MENRQQQVKTKKKGVGILQAQFIGLKAVEVRVLMVSGKYPKDPYCIREAAQMPMQTHMYITSRRSSVKLEQRGSATVQE